MRLASIALEMITYNIAKLDKELVPFQEEMKQKNEAWRMGHHLSSHRSTPLSHHLNWQPLFPRNSLCDNCTLL